MQWGEPAALAIGLGLLAGPLGAALARRGRRALGAALAAAAGAALASAGVSLEPSLARALLAGAAGGVAALALPGFGSAALRRRSFGAAYGRAAFAGTAGDAGLPARCAGRTPSRLLDAADCLRLESALCDAERKSGAEIAFSLVARAGEHEDARWRASAWLAALALCGGLALPAESPVVLAAVAAAALAGRALTAPPRFRRFFVAELALAECAARAARDAFAHAGLLRAPGEAGALVFAALLEGRAIALVDRGLPTRLAGSLARATAEGLAAGRLLETLVECLGELPAGDGAPAAGGALASARPRPHPVRVED
jgi:uncharacterized membrane protein